MRRCLSFYLSLCLLLLPAWSSAQAVTQWRKFQDSPFISGFMEPIAMAIEPGTNSIVITGHTMSGAVRKEDIFIAKYLPNGTLSWITLYDGSCSNNDRATSIDLDSNGNIFVARYSTRSTNQNDFVLLKYSPNGALQWTRTYHGGHGNDLASSVAVDKFNNIVIAGSSGLAEGSGIAILKFSQAGAVHWVKRKDPDEVTVGSYVDAKMDLDDDGNIYVACTSTHFADGRDITVFRFDLSSDFNWLKRIDFGTNEELVDLDVTPQGVFFCGSAANTFQDIFAAKYTHLGAEAWATTLSGSLAFSLSASDLAVSPSGEVFVSGVSGPGVGITAFKFAANGSHAWTRSPAGESNADVGYGIAADPFGNCYLAGRLTFDAFTGRYSPAGTLAWSTAYNNSGDTDENRCVALDSQGNVVTAGLAQTVTGKQLLVTQKFVQTPVSFADLYTAVEGNAKVAPAPGILGNDWFAAGATLNVLTNPTKGVLEIDPDGSFTYSPNIGQSGADSFTYRLAKGAQIGNTVTVTFNIAPLSPASLTFNPPTIYSGQQTTGTVTLNGVGFAGGTQITVTSNSSALLAPAAVMVAQGDPSATFQVQAGPVGATAVRTVTVSRSGVSKTASITINPSPALVSLVLTPSTVVGGNNVSGRVNLASAAPPGGLQVAISDNSTAITTPAMVTVPAGAMFVDFAIQTAPVGQMAVRQVSATLNGVTKTANLTLTPP